MVLIADCFLQNVVRSSLSCHCRSCFWLFYALRAFQFVNGRAVPNARLAGGLCRPRLPVPPRWFLWVRKEPSVGASGVHSPRRRLLRNRCSSERPGDEARRNSYLICISSIAVFLVSFALVLPAECGSFYGESYLACGEEAAAANLPVVRVLELTTPPNFVFSKGFLLSRDLIL